MRVRGYYVSARDPHYVLLTLWLPYELAWFSRRSVLRVFLNANAGWRLMTVFPRTTLCAFARDGFISDTTSFGMCSLTWLMKRVFRTKRNPCSFSSHLALANQGRTRLTIARISSFATWRGMPPASTTSRSPRPSPRLSWRSAILSPGKQQSEWLRLQGLHIASATRERLYRWWRKPMVGLGWSCSSFVGMWRKWQQRTQASGWIRNSLSRSGPSGSRSICNGVMQPWLMIYANDAGFA